MKSRSKVDIMPRQQLTKVQLNPDQETKEARECRICLDGDHEDDKLIEPCQCAGSLTFVHESCLKKWLSRKMHMIHQSMVECQLCKQKMRFDIVEVRRICSWEEFKDMAETQKKSFIFLTILLVLSLSFSIFLITLLSDMASSKTSGTAIKATIGTSLSLTLTLLVISVTLYLKEFVVKDETIIARIHPFEKKRKQSGPASKIQILEFQ